MSFVIFQLKSFRTETASTCKDLLMFRSDVPIRCSDPLFLSVPMLRSNVPMFRTDVPFCSDVPFRSDVPFCSDVPYRCFFMSRCSVPMFRSVPMLWSTQFGSWFCDSAVDFIIYLCNVWSLSVNVGRMADQVRDLLQRLSLTLLFMVSSGRNVHGDTQGWIDRNGDT